MNENHESIENSAHLPVPAFIFSPEITRIYFRFSDYDNLIVEFTKT